MATKAQLRVVEAIGDPVEVAERETKQVTAEKNEISAQLSEILSKKAADDAIVASGDHRKVTDELLVRRLKYDAGIAALEKALEVSEARRIKACDHESDVRLDRIKAAATTDMAAAKDQLARADADLAVKVDALLVSCAARDLSVQTASAANQHAEAYSVAPTTNVRPTIDVLAELAKPHGIFIGPAGVVRPHRIVG
jgi:hypothetical protein